MSIPAFRPAAGRALSVQMVGARHGDQRLLAIVRYLEDKVAVTIDYEDLARTVQMDVRRHYA